MTESANMIRLAVIVIILSVLLTLGFMVFGLGYRLNQGYESQLDKIFGKTGGPSFEKYDGRTVDGDFVRECMREYGGEYFIRVKTIKNPLSFCVLDKPVNDLIVWEEDAQNGVLVSITEPNSQCFVPRNKVFDVTVLYKSEDNLLGVFFEQQNNPGAKEGMDSKNLALTKVANDLKRETEGTIASKVNGVQGQIDTKKSAIKRNKENSQTEINASVDTRVAFSAYTKAYDEYATLKKSVDDAWEALMEKARSAGHTVYGHVAISPDAEPGSVESKEYWIKEGD